MPAYNYGFSAPLKNALDFLHQERQYKPVGFVSYGVIATGTRAVQMIKQAITALKMIPVTCSLPLHTAVIVTLDSPWGVLIGTWAVPRQARSRSA